MGSTREEVDARLFRLIHQPLLEDSVFGTVTLASLYSSLGGTRETLAAMQILGIVPENTTIGQLEEQIEGYQHDLESFRGLLNIVKGRVAEIRQVETLNASPEFQANGWHAVFAPTTNYPDVDIFVLDRNGQIIEAQQIKAGSLGLEEKVRDLVLNAGGEIEAEVQQRFQAALDDLKVQVLNLKKAMELSEAGARTRLAYLQGVATRVRAVQDNLDMMVVPGASCGAGVP